MLFVDSGIHIDVLSRSWRGSSKGKYQSKLEDVISSNLVKKWVFIDDPVKAECSDLEWECPWVMTVLDLLIDFIRDWECQWSSWGVLSKVILSRFTKEKGTWRDVWSAYVIETCLINFVDDIVYCIRSTFPKKFKICKFIYMLVRREHSNILGLVWCYVKCFRDHKWKLLEVYFHEIVYHTVCDLYYC